MQKKTIRKTNDTLARRQRQLRIRCMADALLLNPSKTNFRNTTVNSFKNTVELLAQT